ncbi:hypothetical protein KIN20_019442 [Parelaphostrongylus tenuis]|uniref:Uncharacterized protein n=1 Tax=Parelaphostrongylus tenuis TaxID=148309 RepID=A0AAD5N8R0_PARTN|nr:hypothetical protein KIN20_019442 [Parelaphostrongylus tenuis]
MATSSQSLNGHRTPRTNDGKRADNNLKKNGSLNPDENIYFIFFSSPVADLLSFSTIFHFDTCNPRQSTCAST